MPNLFSPTAEQVQQNEELRCVSLLRHDIGDQSNKMYIMPNEFGPRAEYVWQNEEWRCLRVLKHDIGDQSNYAEQIQPQS